MITDNLLIFSGSVTQAPGSPAAWTGQNIFATNATITGTNVIDTDPTGTHAAGNFPDLGIGSRLLIDFWITAAVTGGTSVTFQLVQADDAALSTNPEVIVQSNAIAVASLTTGTHIPVTWDIAAPYTARRYIGVKYVNVGANAAGACVAQVVLDFQNIKNITGRSGFTVT